MFADKTKMALRGLACLMLAGLLPFAAHARDEAPVALSPGQQHVLVFAKELEKVAVSSPDVASIQASGDEEVLVTAKAAGEAAVRVWLKGDDAPLVTDYGVPAKAGKWQPVPSQERTDIRVVEG